jgi:hypothetical protein
MSLTLGVSAPYGTRVTVASAAERQSCWSDVVSLVFIGHDREDCCNPSELIDGDPRETPQSGGTRQVRRIFVLVRCYRESTIMNSGIEYVECSYFLPAVLEAFREYIGAYLGLYFLGQSFTWLEGCAQKPGGYSV